jgi:hypothetical protein
MNPPSLINADSTNTIISLSTKSEIPKPTLTTTTTETITLDETTMTNTFPSKEEKEEDENNLEKKNRSVSGHSGDNSSSRKCGGASVDDILSDIANSIVLSIQNSNPLPPLPNVDHQEYPTEDFIVDTTISKEGVVDTATEIVDVIGTWRGRSRRKWSILAMR